MTLLFQISPLDFFFAQLEAKGIGDRAKASTIQKKEGSGSFRSRKVLVLSSRKDI
jgi:hypothetical protein